MIRRYVLNQLPQKQRQIIEIDVDFDIVKKN